MPYYNTCPYCGAHLDPGERCDCRDRQDDPPPTLTPKNNFKEDIQHE